MFRLPSSRIDRATLAVAVMWVALSAYFAVWDVSRGRWWVLVLHVSLIALYVPWIWRLSRPVPNRRALASRES